MPDRVADRKRSVFAEYVRTELLTTLSREESRFMLQTSVLRRMSPDLCDFVLQQAGPERCCGASSAPTCSLWRPLAMDAGTAAMTWVREALLAEWQRDYPALPALLAGRAAEWHAANLMPAEAVHYRQDAGDDAATVRLMAAYAQQLFGEGRTRTLSGWWDWAEARDALRLEPELAMSGAISLAMSGGAERAERFAGALYARTPRVRASRMVPEPTLGRPSCGACSASGVGLRPLSMAN